MEKRRDLVSGIRNIKSNTNLHGQESLKWNLQDDKGAKEGWHQMSRTLNIYKAVQSHQNDWTRESAQAFLRLHQNVIKIEMKSNIGTLVYPTFCYELL